MVNGQQTGQNLEHSAYWQQHLKLPLLPIRKTLGKKEKRLKYGMIIITKPDIPGKHAGKFMGSLLKQSLSGEKQPCFSG